MKPALILKSGKQTFDLRFVVSNVLAKKCQRLWTTKPPHNWMFIYEFVDVLVFDLVEEAF